VEGVIAPDDPPLDELPDEPLEGLPLDADPLDELAELAPLAEVETVDDPDWEPLQAQRCAASVVKTEIPNPVRTACMSKPPNAPGERTRPNRAPDPTGERGRTGPEAFTPKWWRGRLEPELGCHILASMQVNDLVSTRPQW
jgi:hypothetical protein